MKYRITLDRWGGEYCVGSIPRETINYWSGKDIDDLKEHLLADTIIGVPQEHNLHPFYEQDNLVHTCGVELSKSNMVTVEDADTDEAIFEATLDADWVKDNAFVINDEPDNLPDDTGIIHTVSIEKGSWVYEIINLDEPLDHKKLKFFMYYVDNLYVVSHMMYEDIELEQIDGFTIGKDFQVWFSD
jgi:hypothetical protein